MAFQRTRRLASLGRSLRSLGSPLNAYPLGGRGIIRPSQLLVLIALIAISGCSYRLHVTYSSRVEKLQLATAHPENYRVRVNLAGGRAFSPDALGRVDVQIPEFGRTCSTYFLFIPIEDRRPEHLPVLAIMAGESTVRRLSLHDLSKLHRDSKGYLRVALR